MGFFIVGTAVALVLLQTTLLLMDREQTSWTFHLIEKNNAPKLQTLDMLACLERHNHSNSPLSSSYCLLWYHTSQQIDPVLAQWNPHLILHSIACVHCIIAFYASDKKTKEYQGSFSRLYASGMAQQPCMCLSLSCPHLLLLLLLYSTGTLFLLWVITAFIVGFAQHASEHFNTLDSSTWVSSLFLFAPTALFLYLQVISRCFLCFGSNSHTVCFITETQGS